MARQAVSELRADFQLQQQRSGHRVGARQAAPTVDRPPSHRRPQVARSTTRSNRRIGSFIFGAALIVLLAVGWMNRNEGHLTPENGLGYWLGIAGAGSMLLLLMYPLRKRIKALRVVGSVAFWFRVHMVLGLVGPALILFHSNFQLGSVNSNVALFVMLIVAASGVAGRYLYGKIHLGLHGRKIAVQEILADADALRRLLGEGLPVSDRIITELNTFGRLALTPRTGVLTNLWWMSILSARARLARKRLSAEARRLIKHEGRRHGWSRRIRRQRLTAAVNLVTLHLATVKKAAAFAFYERLFSLWHVLHLPLFLLLVLAAVVHVVAVHLY